MHASGHGKDDHAVSDHATHGAEHDPHEAKSAPTRYSATSSAIPAIGGEAHAHAPSASERAYHEDAHPHAAHPHHLSQARPGQLVDVNVSHLVGDSTHLNAATADLVHGMQANHLSVAAPTGGLGKLEEVFRDPANVKKLEKLTGVHDAKGLLPWLYKHEAAVVPTTNGHKVNRAVDDVVGDVVNFLHSHHGAHAMIDEAGTNRFELVQHAAHTLGTEHDELRGEWGAFISGGPGGLKGSKPRAAFGELRDAGASVSLEGYKEKVNPWAQLGHRLAQAKETFVELRTYFAHPGFAAGVDGKRVGLPRLEPLEDQLATLEAKRHTLIASEQAPGADQAAIKHQLAQLHGEIESVEHQLAPIHRTYVQRLKIVMARAHAALPGTEVGSWVSRLDGDQGSDRAELAPLLHGHGAPAKHHG